MKMLKKLMCVLAGCAMLTGCQMFQNTEAIQEKVIEAAKNAVIKVAYAKIDKKENLSPDTKEFLKEVASNFIDQAFERLKDEYQKLSQKDIEEDMNKLVDNQIETVCGSYLKMQKK
jgi:4-alpha-glucanotransferase